MKHAHIFVIDECYSSETNDIVAASQNAFDTINIAHPRQSFIHSRLDFLIKTGECAGPGKKKTGLRFLGPSYSCKTTSADTFIEAYLAANPPASPDEIPIIKVSLRSAATSKRMWADLLRTFEPDDDCDDFADRGSEETLKRRFYSYAKRAKVKLIIVDEVHHLYHKEGKKTAWNVAESLKTVLDDGVAPIAFFGTFEALRIFQSNAQLANRLLPPVDLHPLKWAKPDDQELLVGFLTYLDKACVELKLTRREAGLGSPEIAELLHFAAGGILGGAAQIVRAALEVALRRAAHLNAPVDRLEVADLSFAVSRWSIPHGLTAFNPFELGLEKARKADLKAKAQPKDIA